MTRKQNLFTSLAFVILLISCSKDPEPGRQYFYMDSDFRDHSFFKPGSWWIYKKDTLTQDSVAVISSSFSLIEPDSADYSWQRSALQYSSSFYNDTTTLLGDFYKPASLFYLKQVNDSGQSLVFFSLKPAGFVLNLSPALQMRYREIKDTTINGTPYGAVRIFENLAAPSSPTQPKELWYAKNIGIIRKELFNGEVWFLDRYFVTQ